jgi:protein-disulfide isomerase
MLIQKLKENSKIEQLNQEINSIKANEDIFSAILKQRPYYEANTDNSQIYFGNVEAKLRISILTNPFCNPCAGMHQRVESLLRKTNNQVCVQYIFSSFDESLDFANKYLIAAYLQKERGEFERIIADWFARGKVLKEAFFNDLQLNMNNSDIEIEFQKHELWKAKTRLRATPTVLVNGYHLPNNYKIEDLVYFTGFEIDVNQSLSR